MFFTFRAYQIYKFKRFLINNNNVLLKITRVGFVALQNVVFSLRPIYVWSFRNEGNYGRVMNCTNEFEDTTAYIPGIVGYVASLGFDYEPGNIRTIILGCTLETINNITFSTTKLLM